MIKKDWHIKMIAWREEHVPQRHFILILSFVVGILASVAANLLKYLIHLIHILLTESFSRDQVNYWYLLFPAIGILLASLFVRYIVKDDISHGITKILYAISQHKSIIKLHNIWSSLVSSSITIGFGGSVGAEAPIVLTGSAIGSNLGRFFKMDKKTLMLLVGCGAAGAVSGIFKAPIAGLMFTLEVLMFDMTLGAVVPIIISSVTATTLSYVISGHAFMFNFSSVQAFGVERIPFYILLGVVCGLVSLYFTRGMNKIEGVFRKIQSPWKKLLLGGTVLSVLIFFFPPLYGEGYETIEALINGETASVLDRTFFQPFGDQAWVLILYLSLIVFFKIFATASTNGAGGVGGIFAPSLFLGSLTGFVVAHTVNLLGVNFLSFQLSLENFSLAGMSGVMSGVMHAPLTGIFLIAELTGSYSLFMMLMIVSTISYMTIKIFEKHSLYAMRLAQRGELITHDKDKAVLTLLKMDRVIEKDFQILYPKMTLGELVKVISKSKRNLFPVVNPDNQTLIGILLLDEVRNIMFRPELYQRFTVKQLMISPPAILHQDLSMEQVMRIFEDTNAWNLPVVDDKKRYVGFVSKSEIFNSYRRVLQDFAGEQE
ncbi:MAG: Voltage-gated ClC-type chloride channel ClcB [Bacteroidetes bacterium ADurb.Bin174]|nr:MAG: Voltage-gated ClC-type chloride channel ClcB [Bacteroidetes bacterium ADurb.Bin174]